MQNENLGFGFLTRISTLAHHYFLVFQIASEIGIKGISLRYVGFITSLSEGTVDIN